VCGADVAVNTRLTLIGTQCFTQSATLKMDSIARETATARRRRYVMRKSARGIVGAVVMVLCAETSIRAGGPEFQVTTSPLLPPNGGQVDLAANAAGDWVVVWADADADLSGIYGRAYRGTGQVSGIFAANSITAAYQVEPTVSFLPLGDFLVVGWRGSNLEIMGDVFVRTFTPSGMAVGTEVRLNRSVLEQQNSPRLVRNSVHAVWTTYNGGLASTDILAKRDIALSLEDDWLVNLPYIAGIQDSPAAAYDGSRLMIVWTDVGREGGGDPAGIYGCMPNVPSQYTCSSDFHVNTTTAHSQDSPDVAGNVLAPFVVAWNDRQDGKVRAQRYDPFGNPLGGEFLVSGTTSPDFRAYNPSVAVAPGGEFMIVFRGSIDTNYEAFGVFGRRYNSAGTPLGPVFPVSIAPLSGLSGYRAQAVAADGAGNFVVGWTANSNSAPGALHVFARRYAACGANPDTDGDGLCNNDDNCPLDANPTQTPDSDGDGAGDPCDTCPAANPDQRDSDGDCDAPGANLACGDACEACPIDAANTCDQTASGGATIGPAGGTLQKGAVTLTVPAGAVAQPTSFSITKLPASEFGVGQGAPALDIVKLGPEGVPAFNPRVTVRFSWTDAQIATLSLNESNVRVYQNGVGITNTCGDSACRLPACTTGTGCGRAALNGVPGICCDPIGNTWTVPLSQFSEFVVTEDPCDEVRECAAPRDGSGTLQLVDNADDAKDKLVWKFVGAGPGTADDFGDPVRDGGTDYALCLYDATGAIPTTIGRVVIPAGGDCDGVPCWKGTGTSGFRYKRKDGAPEGAVKLVLKSGTRVKVALTGKGAALANRPQALPAPPLGSPPLPALRAQLRASTGGCWEGQYPTANANRPGRFSAKPVPRPSTTTTITTTTTTSSTTTTLTPACGDAAAPQCDGTCPTVGEFCESAGGSVCFCRSYACGWPGSPCLGECAGGGVCVQDGGGSCTCEAGSQPCESASGPECDGTCGPFEFCHHDGAGACFCAPLGCGVIGTPPQCLGECPGGEVCRELGGTCVCTP
jgi:hypothetical protein